MVTKKKLSKKLCALALATALNPVNASDTFFVGEMEYVPSERSSLEMYAEKSFNDLSCAIFNLNQRDLDSDNTFTLLREDCLYRVSDNVEVGVASKQVLTNDQINTNNGIISRFKFKGDDSLGILNLRYFPEEKRSEIKGLYETENTFSEGIVAYNNNDGSDTGFVNIGVSRKLPSIDESLSIGLEINIDKNSDKNHTGIKVRYKF